MQFRIAAGAPYNNRDARVIGNELMRLRESGPLTAARLVEEAKSRRSPLHQHFEWDDTRAAEAYRLRQATQIMRSIEVVVEDAKKRQVNMRAFFPVTDSNSGRSWQPATYVFERPELASQIIKQARAQLEGWTSRFKRYTWAAEALPHLNRALRAIRKGR